MMENLVECTFFRGLSENELEDLFKGIKYQRKRYEKEQVIAYADDEVKSLKILIEGTVRTEMMDYSGKTIKIEDLESPELLAPAFLFGKANRYPVTIIANTDVYLFSILKTDFIQLIQSNEKLLENFLNNISNRAQFLSSKIRFLSFQSIKGKIAQYLLQLSRKLNSADVILPKSQNELAEVFGVARPSLGRTIRELDKEGVIKAEGKKITILEKEKLKSYMK